MSTMAETGFLDAVVQYLANGADLKPVPATVGIAEPMNAGDLPAIVLSFDSVQRLGSGLGERSAMITDGALPWTATIDLANPVLPEEPAFSLLVPDRDRKELILPHGGLRRSDGSAGALTKTDLSVTVQGQPRKVVTAAPSALDEVQADPAVGLLIFGSSLPAAGKVVATYVLGQWERRVVQIAGVLRVDVRASAADPVAELSTAVIEALLQSPQERIKGLRKIALTGLSSVGLPDATRADSRVRTASFSFDYEHEVNRPESSGGIIQRIPINAHFDSGT